MEINVISHTKVPADQSQWIVSLFEAGQWDSSVGVAEGQQWVWLLSYSTDVHATDAARALGR